MSPQQNLSTFWGKSQSKRTCIVLQQQWEEVVHFELGVLLLQNGLKLDMQQLIEVAIP